VRLSTRLITSPACIVGNEPEIDQDRGPDGVR